MGYLATGFIKGKRYSGRFSDYDFILKVFNVNNLNNLWQIDEKGKRKLIMTNKRKK